MIRMIAIGALLALALSVSAVAAPITLSNWDLETTVTPEFGGILDWGPQGGWADHAGFAKPGNETLGLYFGFYSAQTTETVGQLTSTIIGAGTTYKFWSFANGGGNGGVVPYQIGYAATTGDRTSFVALATNAITITDTWTETIGVTYTTGAAGTEIGKELIVRLGNGAAGGDSDIWFDSFQATATPAETPEPGSLVALSSGLIGLVGFSISRRKA